MSVRTSIEALRFTTEGYQRAKSILQTKYDKTIKILASDLQLIMQLPMFFGNIPVKFREFYQKLQEINDIVRLLIDKLPGIRV